MPVTATVKSGELRMAAPATDGPRCSIEATMSKTNDTSHELSEAQLGQVTGGGGAMQLGDTGRHFDMVTIDVGGGPATGGIGAAKDAWNNCLGNFGYPHMA
jgi:hypothetical protein